MRTLKLTLAYDGAAYVGWQRQAAGVSIQGLLEDALARIDHAPVTVVGAGRTDAGVHALGQVARARVTTPHDTATLRRALNAILPRDVRVLELEDVPAAFNPRFDARSKTYQYWIWNARILAPAARSWSWHVARPLDVDAMTLAARALEGRHDFSAFQSTGSDVETSVRSVHRAGVTRLPCSPEPGNALMARLVPATGLFVVFDIEADGFLRHMVRALVGTLVDIGHGRRPPASLAGLLDGAPRTNAGATAPAHGLVLVRVSYADHADAAGPASGPR